MYKRNLNIELIRIISMLMIVYHHFSVHTNWNFPVQLGMRKYLILSVGNFGKIGVILFILITGFFYSKQNFSLNRILKINNLVTFYSVSIFFISLLWHSFQKELLINSLFPLFFDVYWFITGFIILLLFQPLIKNYLTITEREVKLNYFLIIAAFFYVPVFLGFITQTDDYNNPQIYFIFILIVCLGDLIKDYKRELTTIYFKYILIGLVTSFLIILSKPFVTYFLDRHHLDYPDFFINGTQSISGLLFSSCLFILLLKIDIPTKLAPVILTFSTVSFEVYLIHDNPNIRYFLWNIIFKNVDYYRDNKLIFIVIFEPLLIFLICVLIVKLRKKTVARLFTKE